MGNPVFDEAAGIAAELRAAQAEGRIGGAVLVYNHFVSTGRQQVVVDDYLGDYGSYAVAQDDNATADDYILEPSRSELLDALMPQVLDLRLYAALLDSAAAEHAARMVAMQAATDNAEELLGELTLEYNKGRQQKITSELLDLLGGTAEQ